MGSIKERIADQVIIDLIYKALKAGYVDFSGVLRDTSLAAGSPQGPIISPILCNIYLDKLDKWLEEFILNFNIGRKKANPVYSRYMHAINNAKLGGRLRAKLIKEVHDKQSPG